MPDQQAATPAGANFHFGVREHAMASMANGMAVHGGVRPYVATFFVFTDYMRPALRLAAIMGQPVVYVLTHDSIGVGEDGPTHQPVEHLAILRATPNFVDLRPADANETIEAWKVALNHDDGPVALMLTRQNLPTIDRTTYAPASGVARGAYVLADAAGPGLPDAILMASGSEVQLVLAAHERLVAEGVRSRVVNMASFRLFERQDACLPRERPAGRLRLPSGRRGGGQLRLGTVGRGVGRGRQPRPLRRLGSGRHHLRAVRLYRRERLSAGEGAGQRPDRCPAGRVGGFARGGRAGLARGRHDRPPRRRSRS